MIGELIQHLSCHHACDAEFIVSTLMFFLCNIAPQHDQGMPDLILFRACTAATEARICMCAELDKMGFPDGLQKWALEYGPVFKYFLVGHRLHKHISQTCP